jgi:DNA helicase-2/ATP-dependent DNA helicase PcrA
VDADALLAGLNDRQREAVISAARPLCVHAGAGSGKTRVLTRRIAHRAATDDLAPRHALALTFTRKAAGELRSRLRGLGLRDEVAAGTFHATAYAQLRQHWADRGTTPPTLIDRKVGFVARLLRNDALALDVVGEIEWASARMVGPEHYPEAAARSGRRPPLPAEEMARVLERYHRRKREQNLVDFDDLLRGALRLVERDPRAAEVVRWRHQHLFVDEFQDVNPLQFRLLRAWLGDRDDLFVVGDPNQAIYGWNGADARYLDRFDQHFPGGEVLRLRDNYRSSPQVLAVACSMLDRAQLVAHRPDGPVPVVREHANAGAEAAAIAREVQARQRDGRPWSAQAVLVRTNNQAVLLAEAMATARIPHRLRGADDLLRRAHVVPLVKRLDHQPFDVVVSEIRAAQHEYERDDDPDGKAADFEALAVLAREYAALDPTPSGPGFAAWLRATVRSGDGGADRDVVEVATFHAAKGLEWPVVHVAGVEEGLVPIVHARSGPAKAEERRLLYVALTRAQEELHLHWARRRRFGREERDRQASPYLADVERAIAVLEGAEVPVDGRERLRSARQQLRQRRPPADDATVERLKAWRRQAARAANVPAFVIMHDSTLHAVADTLPATRDELLTVPGIGPVKADRFGDELLAVVSRRDEPGAPPSAPGGR